MKTQPAATPYPSATVLFGLAVRERGPSGKWRLRFLFGRIFALIFAIAVVGYLAVAGVAYAYFQSKGYRETTYVDALMLPLNFEQNRKARSEHHFKAAQAALERQDISAAYIGLRTAVRLDEGHLDARLILAQFQQAFGELALARETLADGLIYGQDRLDYVRAFIQIQLAAQEDQLVIDTASELLPKSNDPDIKNLLAFASAQAHFFRGQYDEAESLLLEYGLADNPGGILLIARVNWNRGATDLAIEQLKAALAKNPTADQLYEALSAYHQEMGDLETARTYAVLRNMNAPLSVGPRIGLLRIIHELGEKEQAQRQASDILRQFRKDERALMDLGNFATNNGDTSLMRRIYQTALEEGFNIAPFALLVIECRIAAGDFAGASQFCQQLDEESPDWLENQRGTFNSLRAVAYYGLGNEQLATLHLNRFLESNQRSQAHTAIARRFEDLGGWLMARRVLQRAYQQNPNNQNALTQLIALELRLGNSAEVSAYLARLLKMRRPSEAVLRDAYQRLGSDQFIFTPNREAILLEMRSLLRAGGQPS